MNNRIKWLGRLGLLCLGIGMGVVVIDQVDRGYRVHEAEIATRPVFDPPGLKYAQVRAPERDRVRGWVVNMPPPPKRPGSSSGRPTPTMWTPPS
jgi:hypothetical protein